MLFIDDGKTQSIELDGFLNHSMRSDHQLDISALDPMIKILFLRSFDAARQQGDGNLQRFDHSMEIEVVLFYQYLCGCHDGSLITALDHIKAGKQRDDCFSASHITLDESVHGMGSFQILLDLLPHPVLSTCELEGQSI